MDDQSPQTPQEKTARAVVAAFNDMEVETIISHRDPNSRRIFLPASMGLKPQNNASYLSSLQKLRAIFHNFSLTINDLLEDRDKKRICMWLSAKADTVAGEYVNEYMWLLDFDDKGKVLLSKEFSDSVMEREFFPKLQAAMTKQQAEQTAAGAQEI